VQRIARILDADPQVTRGKRGVLPDGEAAETGATFVKHPGGNQAQGGFAVEAAAKSLSGPRDCLLESAPGTVIQPEYA
jgi:hypothetical protein